jgi:ubiquinone/menaquinone biosynthesis C-methylase UbiE
MKYSLLSQQRVNYDTIAHLYDEPLRNHELDNNLVAYLEQHPLSDYARVYILDMGCGTGKQLTANRLRFPEIQMVGLDLFAGMLNQAKRRCQTVSWVQSDSAAPPFQANSFDYITNQFSYPHVQHKERMLGAIYHLLKPKGRFVMTNIDPWSMTGWIIYQYFPAAEFRDYQDFLTRDRFIELMREAGFRHISIKQTEQIREENLQDFLNYGSQRYRTSQLMSISDAEYDEGMRRIKADLEQSAGEKKFVKSQLSFVTISGDKE